MKEFIIKPAIFEDAIEPWIWSNDNEISRNKFIIIKNMANKKSIRTFKRTVDKNFITLYNNRQCNNNKIDLEDKKLYLFMNEYFRFRLGVEKHQTVELETKNATFCDKIFKMHCSHPHPTVQYANRVTIWAFFISVIAVLLTVYSIVLSIVINK